MVKQSDKIRERNIRATALREFWGDQYSDSVYLWEGAKSPFTLREMAGVTEPVLQDPFFAPEDILIAAQYCQREYFSLLPRLAAKLNEISGVQLPDTFWRTALGYWLFRHICVVYDKFTCLSRVDIDRTSIRLLEKGSFYIPHNHYDYVYCFCNDFGVQQLVTQYYLLFASAEFPVVAKKFKMRSPRRSFFDSGKDLARKALRIYRSLRRGFLSTPDPQVALCGVYAAPAVAATLRTASEGKIAPIELPAVNADVPVSAEARAKLLTISFENKFEHYLVQTLYYCVPQLFVERFKLIYDVSMLDISKRRFSHIVSESWIGDIPTSIYVAAAQHQGRKFICHEHGSGVVFDQACLDWISLLAADDYVTVGWEIAHEKVFAGGFICRDIEPYRPDVTKTDILYISRTNFPYVMEFNIQNATNACTINGLKLISDFYELLPEGLRKCFVFRPRREANLWDTEHSLEVKERNITVDFGNFSESISKSRIVVIDHLTTGVAELLLMGVPCLIVQNGPKIPLLPELCDIFEELRRCGVMHSSAQSAAAQLNAVYGDVQEWWNSPLVRSAVKKLVSKTLGPSAKTIDHLVGYLKLDAAAR